jgi:hypothetical protein
MWWMTLIDIAIVLGIGLAVTYVGYLAVEGWRQQPNCGKRSGNKWFYE